MLLWSAMCIMAAYLWTTPSIMAVSVDSCRNSAAHVRQSAVDSLADLWINYLEILYWCQANSCIRHADGL
jgi:hypothetical protein